MIFENFDDPNNKDKEISIAEKLIIRSLLVVMKLITYKVKKAKPYGDLQRLGELISAKMDSYEDSSPDEDEPSEVKEAFVENTIADFTASLK